MRRSALFDAVRKKIRPSRTGEPVQETSKSLLLRAGDGDRVAWERLVETYQPMIRGWLLRHLIHAQEADDLTQEVLAVVVRELARFAHGGRPGSFRAWLRTVTVNRAREFWRAGRCRVRAEGDFEQTLDQLADPDSPLTAAWDREHDAHVLRRVVALLESEFEPATVRAFRRLVFDGCKPADVAAELGLSLAATYGAKARVLARLRQEADGLLD
jgi:RNA polymerase sigma-70 factor (ECF subfamily)